MKPDPERLEVTTEELEALLESVREPLGEVGYQKPAPLCGSDVQLSRGMPVRAGIFG